MEIGEFSVELRFVDCLLVIPTYLLMLFIYIAFSLLSHRNDGSVRGGGFFFLCKYCGEWG